MYNPLAGAQLGGRWGVLEHPQPLLDRSRLDEFLFCECVCVCVGGGVRRDIARGSVLQLIKLQC